MKSKLKTLILLTSFFVLSCHEDENLFDKNISTDASLTKYFNTDKEIMENIDSQIVNEIELKNGIINFTKTDDDEFINGKFQVEFNDLSYKFYFSSMKKSDKEGLEIYNFTTTGSAEVIEDSLILLSESKVSIFVKENKVISINISDGRFLTNHSNIIFKNIMSILDESYNISNNVNLELGFFQIPLIDKNFKDIMGDIHYPIKYKFEENYQLNNNWLIRSVNLNPSIYLYGNLIIDRRQLKGEGIIKLTLFENPIKIDNFHFPKILTKHNPISIEGYLEYNYLTKYFCIYTEKSLKSGNLSVHGRKSLKAILDLDRFGFKYFLSGKLNYKLDSLKLWCQLYDDNLDDILKKKENLPFEDWLMIKAIQQANVDFSILFKQETLLVSGSLGFNILYNPDEIDMPKFLVKDDLFTPIIDIKFP